MVAMRMFQHEVRVFGGSGRVIGTVDAWVDTGATYSWLP
jgi:hypothetical protein